MQVAVKERKLVSSGGMTSASFGISMKMVDQVHLIILLRSKLYSNKPLAVLREYSANGWDSHQKSGCPEKPLHIGLPTVLDPHLSIRDFGSGLSEEDVLYVYTQYGASTKRGSDDEVGCIGVGSKSAFAYADTFTIISWFEGMKKVYLAVIDDTNVGLVTKVHEEPCGDETGIEIRLAIKQDDFNAFHEEARWLFPYFRPLPVINVGLKEVAAPQPYKHGFFYDYRPSRVESSEWVAVMGCIPYPFKVSLLGAPPEIESFLKKIRGALLFKIGEVEHTADREGIEFTDKTKKAIIAKARLFMEEVREALRSRLNNKELSDWDRLLDVTSFASRYNLGNMIPDMRRPLYGPGLEVDEKGYFCNTWPESFTLCAIIKGYDYASRRRKIMGTPKTSIKVQEGVELVIVDTNKALSHYFKEDSHVMVLIPKPGFTIEQVQAEAKAALKMSELEGIPICLLSQRTVVRTPPSYGSRTYSEKYSQVSFVLDMSPPVNGKDSECWKSDPNWVPQKDDVYVILDRFLPVGRCLEGIRNDLKSFQLMFSVQPPVIHGLKTTQKKPIVEKDVPATPYKDWAWKVIEDGLKARPELVKLYLSRGWKSLPDISNTEHEMIRKSLGKDHSIPRFFDDIETNKRLWGRADQAIQIGVNRIEKWITKCGPPASLTHLVDYQGFGERQMEAVFKPYPLLIQVARYKSNEVDVYRLYNSGREHWYEYIRLIDERNQRQNP